MPRPATVPAAPEPALEPHTRRTARPRPPVRLRSAAVGTNADKHARQKERRSRVDEARRAGRAAGAPPPVDDHRRRACSAVARRHRRRGRADPRRRRRDRRRPTTTTTTAGDRPRTTTAVGTAAELPAPPEGITLTEATACPPAEGSAERVAEVRRSAARVHRPRRDLHRHLRHHRGRLHRHARRRRPRPRRSTTSWCWPATTTTTACRSTGSCPGFVIQAGDGDGDPWGNNDLGYDDRRRAAGRTRRPTPTTRWPWPTPGPTPTAASSSSCCPAAAPSCSRCYSLFGQVTEGTEVVDAIGALGDAERRRRPRPS